MLNKIENIQDFVTYILEKNTNQIAKCNVIISDEITLSYEQLYQKVLEVELFLKNKHLPENTSIGLRFTNQVMLLIFSLTLFKLGIRQVILNPSDVINIQISKINDCEIDLIIQDISLNNFIKEETIFVDFNLNTQRKSFRLKKVYKNYNNSLIAFIGSGTTGKAKLIELSSKVLTTQIKNDLNVCPFSTNEIFYSYSSIHYQFPLRRIITAITCGLTILFAQKKPKNLIDFCIQNNINHLLLTGDQARSFLLKDVTSLENNLPLLPKLKSCVLASSLINEPLRQKIKKYITTKLYISYGTNEFGNISEATPNDLIVQNGNVGKINPDVKVKIVNSKGKECKKDEVGNILVQTDFMISSYRKNEEATKKSFFNGWFIPGDLGKISKENCLVIEGRSDDMMIYSGVNIYPRELESLLESHPKVVESAVFPIKVNNQDGIPLACVVLNNPISEKELLQYCKSKVGWKKPSRIFTVNKLPKNLQGKVLKRELIKLVMSQLSLVK